MNDKAIIIENLCKDFKVYHDKPMTLKERLVFWKRDRVEVRPVLKDINITINKGESVAIIGTNGSGKSTLLKLMTKIIYPRKGTLETHGKLVSLLELGAGFHPDFTGRENIFFNASIFGLSNKEISDRVEEIIDFSEIREFIDNPVRTYSSGMYARLAFAIATNVDADIILLDEVLSVGDFHFQEKCEARMASLTGQDKTLVLVTHSLQSAQGTCERAIWIYNGEVKMDGKVEDVVKAYMEVCK